jgi:hypothetical protein
MKTIALGIDTLVVVAHIQAIQARVNDDAWVMVAGEWLPTPFKYDALLRALDDERIYVREV